MIDLFIQVTVFDIIDILLVAGLFFGLYRLLKGTSAMSIFIGIVAIFLIWQLVKALNMEMLTAILGAFVSVGFIALIIIFQPEIRRFLFTIGDQAREGRMVQRFKFFRVRSNVDMDIDSVTKACLNMSDIKQGALILLTRKNNLDDIVSTGVVVNADISNSLIENIFFTSGFIMSKTAFKAASSFSRGSVSAPNEETAALNEAKSGKAVWKNFKAQVRHKIRFCLPG